MAATYTLGRHNQLIDLNDDLVNFHLTFDVKSVEGKPFKLSVVNQKTLDTNPDIQFNDAPDGEIGGEVSNDNGVYENYFLILKSMGDEQNDVVVTIVADKIPQKTQPPVKTPTLPKPQPHQPPKSKSMFTLKNFLYLCIIVLVVGLGVWYFWGGRATTTSPPSNPISEKQTWDSLVDSSLPVISSSFKQSRRRSKRKKEFIQTQPPSKPFSPIKPLPVSPIKLPMSPIQLAPTPTPTPTPIPTPTPTPIPTPKLAPIVSKLLPKPPSNSLINRIQSLVK